MKKEATPKCKGLRNKTSDEKRGNPKQRGANYRLSPNRKANRTISTPQPAPLI
jgi:hypothetical protein